MSLPHAFTTNKKAVMIDLARDFSGYTSSPSCGSPAATHGSVVISGKMAAFTPNECGFATFQLKATDSAGATMTKSYAVFVDGDCR